MLSGDYRRDLLRLVAVTIFGVIAAQGQNTTAGALTGTVTDPSGAVVG
jgi:hypothetical protein